jgi:hypothetical protein
MTDDLTMKIAVALLSKVVGVGYQARGYMNVGDAYDLAESVAAVVNAHNTVETLPELEELPDGTVYLDAHGKAGQIARGREHHSALPVNRYAIFLYRVSLPATVLYRPTTSGDADV